MTWQNTFIGKDPEEVNMKGRSSGNSPGGSIARENISGLRSCCISMARRSISMAGRTGHRCVSHPSSDTSTWYDGCSITAQTSTAPTRCPAPSPAVHGGLQGPPQARNRPTATRARAPTSTSRTVGEKFRCKPGPRVLSIFAISLRS